MNSETTVLHSDGPTYWITRVIFLRALGFVYFFAYLSLATQVRPLFSAEGILPIADYLNKIVIAEPDITFFQLPTLLWFNSSDGALVLLAYSGLALSLLVLLGAANSLIMFVLWISYLSFVNTGQIFYGYGWETLLLEAGFIAIFLCPLFDFRLIPDSPPPPVAIYFLRWTAFRVMLGAGLIKLRGDNCWWDLTCLIFHYETQPLPNPLSWYFHNLPPFVHKLGAIVNHFIEVVVPWFFIAPRRLRHTAAILTIMFQMTLILSGNLSFLNYLTIAVAIPLFDDQFFLRFGFRRFAARLKEREGASLGLGQLIVSIGLTVILGFLSVPPILNLISPGQMMNASFEPFHLLNTYGAFGSVSKVRHEIILEGTEDERATDNTHWKEYEFLCKPGNPSRRPCIIAPYQPRIDWQIWFAAMQDINSNPWLLNLVVKLLEGNKLVAELLENNPFPDSPPRLIRARLYRYTFAAGGSEEWWSREYLGEYSPPLSISTN